MHSIEIYDTVEDLTNRIESECKLVPAARCGLDPRCGLLLVGEDFVASRRPRELDYYGGFEYIHEDDIMFLGKLKIYSRTADRVNELSCWEE